MFYLKHVLFQVIVMCALNPVFFFKQNLAKSFETRDSKLRIYLVLAHFFILLMYGIPLL